MSDLFFELMKLNIRSLHRDLGYFYLGLIISFSISGLLQNHRDSWKPEKYTVVEKQVDWKPMAIDQMEESEAKFIGKSLGIEDKFRKVTIKKGVLKISY